MRQTIKSQFFAFWVITIKCGLSVESGLEALLFVIYTMCVRDNFSHFEEKSPFREHTGEEPVRRRVVYDPITAENSQMSNQRRRLHTPSVKKRLECDTPRSERNDSNQLCCIYFKFPRRNNTKPFLD